MKTLYHYCPTSSFTSIISSKSIWLSSLSLSNDTMEGRLVSQAFERLLSQSTVSNEEMEEIRSALKFTEEELFDGLGFCLSEEPDLLSQWRGYADDGQGLSIGFSTEYLNELAKTSMEKYKLGFEVSKVLYEPSEHEAALKPIFDKVTGLIDSGKLKKPIHNNALVAIPTKEMQELSYEHRESIKVLWHGVARTFTQAHLLKSKAFAEEVEWRLVSYLAKDREDLACFRAAGDRLIPYREFKLNSLPVKAIPEVYIGPKNITPNFVIEKFLWLNGFQEVTVKRSAATYR